jgi:MFS superfamily sulfate permease-like transporter
VGYPIINLFPRFLLGGLVFFAGLGFVVENLVDTLSGPTKFSTSDYMIVLLIVFTTIVSEMIYGVIFGVIIALILYMLGGIYCRAVSDRDIEEKHALVRLSEIDGGWTKVVRPQVDKIKLRGLEDLVMIAEVAKFLFFGSLCELQIAISNWLDEREHRMPPCRRAKYLVLDLSDIEGLDPRLASKSAMEEIVSIVKQVHSRGVITVLAGFDPFDPGNPCHRCVPAVHALSLYISHHAPPTYNTYHHTASSFFTGSPQLHSLTRTSIGCGAAISAATRRLRHGSARATAPPAT